MRKFFIRIAVGFALIMAMQVAIRVSNALVHKPIRAHFQTR